MITWRLKKGGEKKFRFGHPWVFSNELDHSPKGLDPGSLVELRDAQDNFLALGYGHPNSLISFRVLTRQNGAQIGSSWLVQKLLTASNLRAKVGLSSYSHRLCFAEADSLPGLIIDRYLLVGGAQVFVLQSSTAGMEQLLPLVLDSLQGFVQEERRLGLSKVPWEKTAIILSNDSKSRVMEGLTVEEKRVYRDIQQDSHGVDWRQAQVLIQPALGGPPLVFTVDFIDGQKTGFFLDQRLNIQLASQIVQNMIRPEATVKILDICCYIGQWSTQLAHIAAERGVKAEVTLVDASQKALEIAAQNSERQGAQVRIEKLDVLKDFAKLTDQYDIVICDPPAFIKKKKDLPTGQAAYYKLNREAMKKVKPGGLFVSCSCSGLFTDEDFRTTLAKASASQTNEIRWLMRGSHSPDHPQKPEFPQGSYLKSWIGLTMTALCALFVFCTFFNVSKVQAASWKTERPLTLSSQVHASDKENMLSHRGDQAFSTYLSMAIPFAPIQQLHADLERELGVRLVNRGEAHITLVTPPEFDDQLKKHISIDEIEKIAKKFQMQAAAFEVVCLGRGEAQVGGKAEQTYFVVVRSPALLEIRSEIQKRFLKNGGDVKKFSANRFYPHITVGFTKSDLHENQGVIKSEDSCWRPLRN